MFNNINLVTIHANAFNKFVNAVMSTLFSDQELAEGYIIDGATKTARKALDPDRIKLLKGTSFELGIFFKSQYWFHGLMLFVKFQKLQRPGIRKKKKSSFGDVAKKLPTGSVSTRRRNWRKRPQPTPTKMMKITLTKMGAQLLNFTRLHPDDCHQQEQTSSYLDCLFSKYTLILIRTCSIQVLFETIQFQ